jgi:hypothetical protein
MFRAGTDWLTAVAMLLSVENHGEFNIELNVERSNEVAELTATMP